MKTSVNYAILEKEVQNKNYLDLTTILRSEKKELKEIAVKEVKLFMLSHCRKGSKVFNSISCLSVNNICDNWFNNRLIFSNYGNGVSIQYVACQDYTEEIKQIKKQLIKNINK